MRLIMVKYGLAWRIWAKQNIIIYRSLRREEVRGEILCGESLCGDRGSMEIEASWR
jgi:hypothetical protein